MTFHTFPLLLALHLFAPAFASDRSVAEIARDNPRHFSNYVNAIFVCLATQGHLSKEASLERSWSFQRKYLSTSQISNLFDDRLVDHYINQNGGCSGLTNQAIQHLPADAI